MKFSIKVFTLLCLLNLAAVGCSSSAASVASSNIPAPTPTPGAYWPTERWPTSTPEEQGIDSQQLADMLAVIQERQINIHSFLVIRNGFLVSETYWGGYHQDMQHDMQSVGRSFTATLIGIAIDKGFIEGVDQRILDFFPKRTIAFRDQQKESMTIEDVLTMRSGLEWDESKGARQVQQQSPDWVQYMLDLPMIEPPGSRWNYCSGCSHLFSAILQETTAMNPRDFAEDYLFKPLGISRVHWMTDPAGIPYGAGGFGLTPRDMAKLGFLYLRNGEWEGQQIVSSDWVKSATQRNPDIEINEQFGYGYHWFTVTSMAGFAAIGDGQQIILAIPELDLVVVTTAKTGESLLELIEQYIIPAVKK